jgi:Cytochrome c554 and c-prime
MKPSSRLFLTCVISLGINQITTAAPHVDPSKVMGTESCGECHKYEVESWKLTHHFSTMNDMHKTPEARAIADKLGVKRIKSESLCLDCHYTSKVIDNDAQVIAGISCESCHGAAKEWMDVHNDFGKGFTKETEPAEHRASRRAKAASLGMLYPENLYNVGQNCYQCHIVTNEELANKGGHTAGSAGFNLLSWSQGEVRHSILRTDNKGNPEATIERKRILFTVGSILDVEYSFRAVARATEKATYAVTNARRAAAARKQLEAIQAAAPTNEMAAIIAIANGAELRLNNSEALTAVADRVSELGRAFAATMTGEKLAGIDALLPDASQFKGTPYTVPAH